MATKTAIGEDTASASKAKLPVMMLLLVVTAGSSLGVSMVGSGFYLLLKSGRISLPAVGGMDDTKSSSEAKSRPVVFEPILVNLADEGGHAYLRLGLTLDLEGEVEKVEGSQDAKKTKTPSEQELAVRDTVLSVLGQQTSAWLLGPDGKEHLKIELEEALSKHCPQLKVKEIFFTEFLVQI